MGSEVHSVGLEVTILPEIVPGNLQTMELLLIIPCTISLGNS